MGFAKVPALSAFRVRVRLRICLGMSGYVPNIFFFEKNNLVWRGAAWVRLSAAGYESSTWLILTTSFCLLFFFLFPKIEPYPPLSSVIRKSHPHPTSKFLILSHQPLLLNRSTTGDNPAVIKRGKLMRGAEREGMRREEVLRRRSNREGGGVNGGWLG